MPAPPTPHELLSCMANLTDKDRHTVFTMVLLLARASRPARRRANAMVAELLANCSDSRIARSRLHEIITYLETETAD